MAGSYLPLIGSNNIVSVIDSAPDPMLNATINNGSSAVPAEGRVGSLRTSLLVSLNDSEANEVPLAIAGLLFTVTVACPAGFLTPTANLVGFDYSQLLPDVRAACVCGGFIANDGVWPNTLETLITAQLAFPANLTAIAGRITAVGYPTAAGASPSYPYGTLTYAFTGAASTAAVIDALIAVSIDFGASAAS